MLGPILILSISIILSSSAAIVPFSTEMNSAINPEIAETFLIEENNFENTNFFNDRTAHGQNAIPVYPDFLLSSSLLDVFRQFKEQCRYNNFMSLPAINSTFLNGKFEAKDGYLRNFKSILMEDLLTIQKAARYIAVSVPFKFLQFEAGYEKYSIDINGRVQSGTLKVTAGSNEITVTFGWVHDFTSCELSLLDVAFETLKDININVDGIDSDKVEELSQWLVTNFEKDFRGLVAKEVYRRLSLLLPYQCSN